MNRLLLSAALMLIFISVTSAGDPVCPAYLIPDTLIRNASAVIRFYEATLDVRSKDVAVYTERKATTVLNSNGQKHTEFMGFYDKQRRISNISIKIFDALGNLIENVKNRDIDDFSASSGYSLYDDNRVMYYKPVVKNYPYTVVTEYRLYLNGYIQLPYWQPQEAPDIAVESASFRLISDQKNPARYLALNLDDEPVESISGNECELSWTVAEITAFLPEIYQPQMQEIAPLVLVAPRQFSYEGYSGSQETWEAFGEWVHQLLVDRDELPDEIMDEVKHLVDDCSDTVEMVRRIYSYMQQHTRYVSIQLGIGGFQPFSATTVAKTGYGDCKALTNYMKALLKAAEIPSVYTLVKAGRNTLQILENFPAQQFNHAILHVPMRNDTIWLECTNQNMPSGYLGKFTDNRLALAIEENGSRLVNIRNTHSDDNITALSGTVMIEADGSGKADLQMMWEGLGYDDVFSMIHDEADSQRKWIYENLYCPNSQIIAYQVNDNPDRIPSAELNLQLKLNSYATKSGKRLFLQLNQVDAFLELPLNESDRNYAICLKQPYTKTDTITFIIPENFAIEHTPEAIDLKTPFGEYASTVHAEKGKIIYTRRLKMNKGRFDAATYPELYAFLNKIIKADKASMVLKSH